MHGAGRGGAFAAALLLAVGRPAAASPVDIEGFGAGAMGRGGGGVAVADDAGAPLLNPAGLAQGTGAEMLVGLTATRYVFAELPAVWWDTNQDGRLDDTDTPLEPPAPAPWSSGLMLALSQHPTPWLGTALAAYVPFEHLVGIQTIDDRLPSYFRYDNRPHAYELAAGAALRLPAGLRVGVGAWFYARTRIGVVMTIDAALDASDPEEADIQDLVEATVDPHEITVEIVPIVAPTFGVQWDLGAVAAALDGLTLAGSWRTESGLPVEVQLDLQVNASVEDLGSLEDTVFAVVTDLALELLDQYNPAQGRFGLAWSPGTALRLQGDLVWTRWSRALLNVAHVVASDLQASLVDLSDLEVQDGNPLDVVLADTLGFDAGFELGLPRWELPWREVDWLRLALRGGVAFDPTPLVEQGAGNALLDADRWTVTAGIGLDTPVPWDLVAGPDRLDLFAQAHVLSGGFLERSAAGGPEPGLPVEGDGFPIGGRFYAGGIQWSVRY